MLQPQLQKQLTLAAAFGLELYAPAPWLDPAITRHTLASENRTI